MTNPKLDANNFGRSTGEVQAALGEIRRRDVLDRIWRGDHTVWKPDSTEISNRLGWLTVADQMGEQAAALEQFASEVRTSGYTHVVLLGMGGSSLGPEVLGRTLMGANKGFPRLIVLDSTVPDRVSTVSRGIDPAKTMFLVSSKSGGTVETLSFYRYFRNLVDELLGRREAGQNFVAITDSGTPLESLALKEEFRKVYANPADIGGRYSVLSYFGLLPAALTGMSVTRLLDRAISMAAGCSSGVLVEENPGAQLGAAIAGFARAGRDKLTLVASKSVDAFGLWVEQLIAESLGKEGKGVIPVTGEPLAPAEQYGQDRWFVYLRAGWDDNDRTDRKMAKIRWAGNPAAGYPVLELRLNDHYDLGAEFFRWQFATAVAGSLLGVNPFDQPDVQGSKDNTDRVLDSYRREGSLPGLAESGSAPELINGAQPSDYLAIMAFIEQTDETDLLLGKLRSRVLERYGIATTLGYGPRFLHSTGQLHKGGPSSGLHLQLTQSTSDDGRADLEIPGGAYTFRTLSQAQALGDFNALASLGRRTARVNLGSDPAAGLDRILRELG